MPRAAVVAVCIGSSPPSSETPSPLRPETAVMSGVPCSVEYSAARAAIVTESRPPLSMIPSGSSSMQRATASMSAGSNCSRTSAAVMSGSPSSSHGLKYVCSWIDRSRATRRNRPGSSRRTSSKNV